MTIVEGCRYHWGTPMLDELLQEMPMDKPALIANIEKRLQGQSASVAQFGHAFYDTLAHARGATISGDNTPEYGACMQTIKTLWPAARFIHIVRDGRSVAQSMTKHNGFRLMAKHGITSWLTVAYSGSRIYPLPREHGRTLKRIRRISEERDFKFPDFIHLWAIRLKRIQEEVKRVPSEDFMELRYEDIQSDPMTAIGHIADFAGIRSDDSWMDSACSMVRSEKSVHSSLNYDVEVTDLLQHYGYA
jgi:hypothetical protein